LWSVQIFRVVAREFQQNYAKREASIVNDVFGGQLRSCTTFSCGFVSLSDSCVACLVHERFD
jgi:hypothetical protein